MTILKFQQEDTIGKRINMKKEFDSYLFNTIKNEINEFDAEIKLIYESLQTGMNVDNIATVITNILNKQFDENFKKEQFIQSAKEIEKALNNK